MSNPSAAHVTPPTSFTSINQKSTVSIALMIVILAGFIGNVSMMYTLKGAVSLVQRDVTHITSGMVEIKASLSQLTSETRRDIRDTQNQVSHLREQSAAMLIRLAELEKDK